MDIWEKSILIQGNIKCKGLEVLNMFKTEKEANEVRLVKGRVVVNQAREVAKSQTAEGFGGWSKNFVFFTQLFVMASLQSVLICGLTVSD